MNTRNEAANTAAAADELYRLRPELERAIPTGKRLQSGGTPDARTSPQCWSGHGLYSTPRDMARYVEWQLDEANPEIMLAHEPTNGDSQSVKALIWNLGTLDGSRMLWHGGGTFGMSSQVVLFPSYNEGYVLLANDTCNGTESALKNLAIVLHGRLRSSVRPPPGDFRP